MGDLLGSIYESSQSLLAALQDLNRMYTDHGSIFRQLPTEVLDHAASLETVLLPYQNDMIKYSIKYLETFKPKDKEDRTLYNFSELTPLELTFRDPKYCCKREVIESRRNIIQLLQVVGNHLSNADPMNEVAWYKVLVDLLKLLKMDFKRIPSRASAPPPLRIGGTRPKRSFEQISSPPLQIGAQISSPPSSPSKRQRFDSRPQKGLARPQKGLARPQRRPALPEESMPLDLTESLLVDGEMVGLELDIVTPEGSDAYNYEKLEMDNEFLNQDLQLSAGSTPTTSAHHSDGNTQAQQQKDRIAAFQSLRNVKASIAAGEQAILEGSEHISQAINQANRAFSRSTKNIEEAKKSVAELKSQMNRLFPDGS